MKQATTLQKPPGFIGAYMKHITVIQKTSTFLSTEQP